MLFLKQYIKKYRNGLMLRQTLIIFWKKYML